MWWGWDVSGMSIIIHSSLQSEYSSLIWACMNNHANVVSTLVVFGKADVNLQNEVSRTSPATCILM